MGDSNDTEHNLEMVFMALAPRVIPHKALRRGGRFITGVVAKVSGVAGTKVPSPLNRQSKQMPFG